MDARIGAVGNPITINVAITTKAGLHLVEIIGAQYLAPVVAEVVIKFRYDASGRLDFVQ